MFWTYLFSIFTCLLLLGSQFTRNVYAQVPPPSIPNSDLLIGAFYFPSWRLDPAIQENIDHGWLSIRDYPNRKPFLGYYDEGNPEVIDWEIKWASEHGVNLLLFDWTRCAQTGPLACDELLGQPIDSAKIPGGHALHGAFLQSTLRQHMKFAINMADNIPYTRPFRDIADLRDNLMPYLINTYFKQPNYLVIDNKPVLFLFEDLNLMANANGDAVHVREVLEIMRQKTRDAGFDDLTIVGHSWQFVNRSMYESNLLKQYGVDYTFSYVTPIVTAGGSPVGPNPSEQQAIDSQKESYEYLAANSPLPFIVTASPFWDSFPYNLNTTGNWYTTPAGFRTILSNAKSIMSRSSGLGQKIIIVDAWNEYGEGHFIAPAAQYGFGYLQSIRDVLTQHNNTPDYRQPTSIGYGPYNTLYQKYLQNNLRPYSKVKLETYTFESPDQFVDIDSVGFTVGDAEKLTYGGWFKADLTATNHYALAKPFTAQIIINREGNGHCAIATDNNTWYSTGTTVSFPRGSITPNNWHHIFCVYDGSHLSVYIDGIKKNTTTAAISGTVAARLFRLRAGYNPHDWASGGASHIIFERSAFSDSEIREHYNNNTPSSFAQGDLDRNGHVDIFDYNQLISAFGQTGNPGFIRSDINRDGIVSIYDYNILLTNFGR